MNKVLAFDFGASSGRAILAEYDNGALTYKEVHRFENIPIEKDDAMFWNIDALMQNIKIGIKNAGTFDSLAFDTWGVDYGLLDKDGKLMQNPHHYRDIRTNGISAQACKLMPAAKLYKETGNQILDMNTLFQLITTDLSEANTLLFIPDLLAYLLCGKAVCEMSIASTSQMLNPITELWSKPVLNAFNIPESLFAPLVKSGTVIGEYNGAKVISVAGHDTQCAVAAIPTKNSNAAFLSCGTWSLLGTELDCPILTEFSKLQELSNEIGANGKINYLKNIIGLWLIQESRREYKRQGTDYSYAELERLALATSPFKCFIDPCAPEFVSPSNIPQRIQEYCRKTHQYVPQSVGEIMRCIYESLAFKYRFTIAQLMSSTQKEFTTLHILGGGAKDRLLCQMTANSINMPVIAGPIEATALGNIIIQLKALGAISDIDEGRNILANTENLTTYTPSDAQVWDAAYKIYKEMAL
ncbi:MAG: rhamnulokinase family protein [Oscillospiraceae bacterium]